MSDELRPEDEAPAQDEALQSEENQETEIESTEEDNLEEDDSEENEEDDGIELEVEDVELPEKFKSVAQLAEAYKELERKLGQSSQQAKLSEDDQMFLGVGQQLWYAKNNATTSPFVDLLDGVIRGTIDPAPYINLMRQGAAPDRQADLEAKFKKGEISLSELKEELKKEVLSAPEFQKHSQFMEQQEIEADNRRIANEWNALKEEFDIPEEVADQFVAEFNRDVYKGKSVRKEFAAFALGRDIRKRTSSAKSNTRKARAVNRTKVSKKNPSPKQTKQSLSSNWDNEAYHKLMTGEDY